MNLTDDSNKSREELIGELQALRTEVAQLRPLANLKHSLETRLDLEIGSEGEENFRQLAEFACDIFWIFDLATEKHIYISPSYEQVWGYSCQSLYANPYSFLDAIAPEDVDRARAETAKWVKLKVGGDIEYQIIKPNGELRWIRSRAFIIHHPPGETYRLAGICEDLTERKKAETALQASEVKWRALFNEAMDAMLIANDEGIYIDANPAACHLFGLSREALIGSSISNFAEPGFDYQLAWQSFLTQGRVSGEFRLYRPDGTVRETEFSATANFLPHHHLSILRDVTQRKQAETQLTEKRQLIERLTESSLAILYIYDLIERCNIYVNQQVQQILGYSAEEIQGMGSALFARLMHPDDWEKVAQTIERLSLSANRTIIDTEYRMRHANGEWRWFYSRDTVFTRTPDGRSQQVFGTAIDITKLKLAEEKILGLNSQLEQRVQERTAELQRINEELKQEIIEREYLQVALQRSQAKLNDLFNSANAAIICFRVFADGSWDYEYQSKGCETIFGYTPQEFSRDRGLWESRVMPDDLPATLPVLFETAFSERTTSFEYRFYHKDGSLRWLSNTLTSRYDADEDCWFVTIVGLDITKRKQIEIALQESEDRFRATFEQAAVGICHGDLEGNVYLCNQKFCEIIGYSQAELKGLNFKAFTHPDDVATESELLIKVLTKTYSVYSIEKRYIRKNGSIVWVNVTVSLLLDENRNPKYCVAVVQDISDRKRIEQALRENQQKYKTLFDILPIAISITNEEGHLIEVNAASEKILGISFKPHQRQNQVWRTIRPDGTTLPRFEFVSNLALRENRVIKNFECGIVKDNGEITWVSATAAPIPLPGYGVAIAYMDITERRQIEEKLRQSEFNLLEAQRIAHLGSWEFDAITKKIAWSEETFRIFGRDSTLGEPSFEDHGYHNFHPADILLWQKTVSQALRDGQPYEMELRVLRSGNILRYVVVRGEAVVNKHQQVTRLFGTVIDITERKEAELALLKQMEREQLLGTLTQHIRQSLKLEKILNTTVVEVRRLLQTERVLLFKLDVNGMGRVVTESVATGWPTTCGETFPDEIFPQEIYDLYCQGKARIVPDITQDTAASCLTEYLQKIGVKSKIVIPILHSSQLGETMSYCALKPEMALWGVMTAHDCIGGRQWQQWEIDLLTSLATQIGIAIHQSELYQQLEAQLTELQQAKTALEKAKEIAEVANRAKSEFLANISHELRTPLNGILGYAQILKKDELLTEDQQNSINIMYQCGCHLLTLIDDILDLSKIEARRMELHLTEFHLPTFLQGIADLFRIRAQQKDIAFTYETLSPIPTAVKADNKRLRQVLINLLSNAVKFTEQGSVKFTVSILPPQIHQDEDVQSFIPASPSTIRIRFQVTDTGLGIDSSQVNEIFLPFRQAGDGSHVTEGTGLGLAISQKLVQLMGSQINVSTILGQGSIFWFDLDLLKVTQWQEQPTESCQIVGFRGDKRKVLIVDDNEINCLMLQQLLQSLGFTTLVAANGQEALQKAVDFLPDLIFMDLVMPGMDGFETTRQLRQLPHLQNVVIIALSANAFETAKHKSLAAGCQDFLAKPIQATQVLQKVKEYLQVEWICAEKSMPVIAAHALASLPTVVLPSQSLTTLAECVKKGDIMAILEQAESIEMLDNNKYGLLASHLRQLAKGFQLKQLQELVKNLEERIQ